jgi:S1-C subfamily serine protease
MNNSPLYGISHGDCKPTVRQIVAQAKKAMLWITALDENHRPVTSGTGFFIDDGCGVLTNFHVIEKGKYFTAQLISTGKTLSDGYLDDSNRACDLAVLRFRGYNDGWKNIHDPELNFNQLYLADDSSVMQEGDRMIVVGNPRGLLGTVVEGLISAIRLNGALFQISAPISEGSSGSLYSMKTAT